MRVIPRRGNKRSIASESARILWFCDEREAAENLDCELRWMGVDDDLANETWPKVREAVLSQMRKTHPGLRPHFWWENDCPQGESRRLISGAGSPYLPGCGLGFGIPFGWQGYSAADPPVFESQASFLKRHGLLSAEEEARADFTLESIRDCDIWRSSCGAVHFKKHARFICVW